MRKSSLKPTVTWQKNEAPKGLAQICMGMKMDCLFRITRDLEQPESPLWQATDMSKNMLLIFSF